MRYLGNTYEFFARRHHGAFPIYLKGDRFPFWSKGWVGCSQGCGCELTQNVALHAFSQRSNGVVRVGWTCNPRAM